MENYIFKIEAQRDADGSFRKDVSLEFDGYDYEHGAALVMVGQKYDFLKAAIIYAADHLQGKHLRDESRVKEDQQENNPLN
jgi:hypothetical protein